MNTIWKIPLATADIQTIEIPAGAKILTLQIQYSEPAIWFEADTNSPLEERYFITIVTGYRIPNNAKYVGTYQKNDGVFVYHVYEVEKL